MTQLLQQLSLPDGFGAQSQAAFDLLALLTRLLVDLLAVGVLVRLIYYPIYRKSDLFLTFVAFNLIIFLTTYLLSRVELSMGAAFGLFAVFSMLRYRSEGLSAKDMTYLFVVIAMGLISAIGNGGWAQTALIHGLILGAFYVLESTTASQPEVRQNIAYDRLDLIAPTRRDEMLRDLQARTGLNVHRVKIRNIDLIKNSVQLTAYYDPYAPTTQSFVSARAEAPSDYEPTLAVVGSAAAA